MMYGVIGSAAIMIENDGTVSIIAQHSDIGVNPWTPLCQIVADELGLRTGDVNVKAFDLDQGFAMMSPDGSCNLVSNGHLIKIAARKARGMLLELAVKKFGDVTAKELDIKDGIIFVKANPEKRKTLREVVSRAVPMSAFHIVRGNPLFSLGLELSRNLGARQKNRTTSFVPPGSLHRGGGRP